MAHTTLADGTLLFLLALWLGGLVYGILGDQDTSTPEKIVTQAYKFLESNLLTGFNKKYAYQYSFCRPSAYKYGPSQWLWGRLHFALQSSFYILAHIRSSGLGKT